MKRMTKKSKKDMFGSIRMPMPLKPPKIIGSKKRAIEKKDRDDEIKEYKR